MIEGNEYPNIQGASPNVCTSNISPCIIRSIPERKRAPRSNYKFQSKYVKNKIDSRFYVARQQVFYLRVHKRILYEMIVEVTRWNVRRELIRDENRFSLLVRKTGLCLWLSRSRSWGSRGRGVHPDR